MAERRLARGCFAAFGFVVAVLLVSGAAFVLFGRYVERKFAPDPVSVATSSLQGLRAQNRLSTFAARYVAVVTSKQSRMGLSAEKTLILPGTVRYEVDLSKLQQRDVQWDAKARRLTVELPQVEVIGPEIDMNAIREYSGGGLLMTFTDAEAGLDAANRKAAQAELIRQAREATPMNLAREATRRAVARSFEMPLKAVGIDASVRVFFPGERQDDAQWDVSRSPAEVLANAD